MNEEIYEKLAELLKNNYGTDTALTGQTAFRADLGLSSFQMMCLLGDIEDEFSVRIDYKEAAKLVTVADAVSLIEKARQDA